MEGRTVKERIEFMFAFIFVFIFISLIRIIAYIIFIIMSPYIILGSFRQGY